MTDALASSQLIERTQLAQALHDALPTAARRSLPEVDWSSVQTYRPDSVDAGDPAPNAPLPEADAVVMTWTKAEWQALHQVFFGDGGSRWEESWTPYRRDYHQIHQYMVDVKRTYQGGAPSLDAGAWGSYRRVRINGLTVLLVKSGMHLAQDGTRLPLLDFVDRICLEAKPRLLLSIGTAGAVRSTDALGTVLITNQARFHLLKEFVGAAFNGTTVQSDWVPSQRFLPQADAQFIQVPGEPIFPISPQYPREAVIMPDPPDSRVEVVDQPIITTDSFLFGTTDNRLDELGCIVEMDDAVVGLACQRHGVAFGFARNVSDPVIDARLPAELQRAWAGYIYQQHGLQTSFNGALATWALLAAESER